MAWGRGGELLFCRRRDVHFFRPFFFLLLLFFFFRSLFSAHVLNARHVLVLYVPGFKPGFDFRSNAEHFIRGHVITYRRAAVVFVKVCVFNLTTAAGPRGLTYRRDRHRNEREIQNFYTVRTGTLLNFYRNHEPANRCCVWRVFLSSPP